MFNLAPIEKKHYTDTDVKKNLACEILRASRMRSIIFHTASCAFFERSELFVAWEFHRNFPYNKLRKEYD